MKKVRKISMVIMGTLIGAGFASGREIYVFFNQFGYYGIIGIIFSSILTATIIYCVLRQAKKSNTEHYADFLKQLNPKHPKMNLYFHLIVNSFLLISFFIMIAGFSAYMKQAYEIPTYFSSSIFVLICYLIFQKNLKGMVKINEYLVPFLLFFIAYLGIKNIPYLIESKAAILVETKTIGFLMNSVLYASYNSIVLIPILVTMKDYCTTSKEIIKVALFCGVIILLLSLCIYGLLLQGQFFVEDLELPLLEISREYGKIFPSIYGFVIIGSIFTSAIATGYSFLENVSKTKKAYHTILIFICIVGILVSNVGFSKLVQILYPLFGILGLLQIGLLLKAEK